ncbi:mitochondrial carrier domain-containing protein [Apiospora marii]|uniref:Mitochondrial carrier domain-containing protein n=1 Tax=Apiospora marii TaxID=335849 RepID=A0ABR1R5I5_9PEZI
MSGSTNRDVMLAGAAAAFTVDLLIYPLDTLKTRQQSQDFLQTFADPAAKTKAPPRHLFRGLYQGIGIVIVATLPAAGTFFTTYEAAKTFLGRHVGPADGRTKKLVNLPQPLVHSAASAFAEMASCVVLTPAEVIKQNAQMVQRQQSGASSNGNPGITGSSSMKALRQLASGGGASAGRKLLSGYTAMVARNLPFTALQFPIFEHVRGLMWKKGEEGKQQEPSLWRTGWITGTSAGLAGSFAAVVTTPMDVVKTRMMLQAGSDEQQATKNQPGATTEASKQAAVKKVRGSRGGLAVARQVLRERGVPGLFRGAVLRAAWTAVGSGLYLGMYEVSKVWLTRGRASEEDSSFP